MNRNACFFVHSLDSGGIENYLLRFLREKNKDFDSIYVWCKSGEGGQLDDSYAALENVSLVKLKLSYFDINPYRELKQFIVENNIDAVCDFTGNFAGRVIYTAKKAGVEKRVTCYRSAANAYKPTILKQLYNKLMNLLVFKYSTNVLSNSKSAFHNFFGDNWGTDKRFKVISNGINANGFISVASDLRDEFGIPTNAYVVGHTGRYNPAKNHSTILKVAKKLTKKHSDIYFILCGNGVKDNLIEDVTKAGLAQRVLLFENRTDIPEFLNTMDCYFFPSTREGQPNALIEAMLMGLPFVASDIPPIRETVGEDYALYPAMDVNALALAIENEYLERRGRGTELQQKMIKRFDYKERFDEFHKVLTND